MGGSARGFRERGSANCNLLVDPYKFRTTFYLFLDKNKLTALLTQCVSVQDDTFFPLTTETKKHQATINCMYQLVLSCLSHIV